MPARDLQTDSYYQARIGDASNSKLKCIATFYPFMILVFVVVGVVAPTIFLYSTERGRDNHGIDNLRYLECKNYDCNPVYYGHLKELAPLHQVFYLEMLVENSRFAEAKQIANQHTVTAAHHLGEVASEMILPYVFNLEMNVKVEGEMEPDGERTVIHNGAKSKTITITCNAGKQLCEPVVMYAVEFIEYTGYHVTATIKHPYQSIGITDQNGYDRMISMVNDEKVAWVPHVWRAKFNMSYVNRTFTEFLFAVKYVCVTIALAVAFIYIRGLRRYVEYKFWSLEQTWVSGLVLGNVAFNDPLYVLEIFTPSPFVTAIGTLGVVTLLCALLFFWAMVFDIVRSPSYWQEGNSRKLDFCFYIPKALLVGLIWFMSMGLYLFVRLQTKEDPTFYAGEKYDHFSFMKDSLAIVLVIYFLYCGAMIALAIKNAVTFGFPPRHYALTFLLSVAALVMAVIGLAIGAFSPEIIYAAEYTTFIGAVNGYCWIMAYAYYPAAVVTRAAFKGREPGDIGSIDGKFGDLEMSHPHVSRGAHIHHAATTDSSPFG